ncbi:MAG: VWA domain-containing protein [Acidobacteriota bacterium]
MKTFILVAAVGLGLGSMLVPMNGQTTRGQERPPVTVRVDTDLVAVDVTATDQSGNYVRDLREDEMEVYEDGKRRRIDFFSVTDEATLSRPIAVVFALDLSGSLRTDEMTTLHQAALKFTELMKGDAVFAALTFNYEIKIIQGFTDDPRRIERAFSKPGDSGGSTRIYDALDRAITMLARQAPKQRRGRSLRRVVMVISDGFDSASVIDKRELIRRAQAAEVTVYSVTLPSYMLSPTRSGERVITPLDAMRIVSATGGRDFSADLADFTPIFKALAEEIRASYVLAYYPDLRDGKFHELRIQTTRAGIRLRSSRNGYTAPGAPQSQ